MTEWEEALVDPAAFDLDDDCCLGGCCEKGSAYLAALDAAHLAAFRAEAHPAG